MKVFTNEGAPAIARYSAVQKFGREDGTARAHVVAVGQTRTEAIRKCIDRIAGHQKAFKSL